ncbi:thioester domain-containing protein [Mycolicibacterium neoaurum]|uniref:TQXA domain protein n=1 Tax=Mycolicibacterium neoaurum TaxID=1795 RepID=A0AAV2WH56_MYCNE|nr:thioester domain-containing protein [Mycolicibacterium neoaurum]TLH50427.1 TQXA domain-containing protein [Mycolicibacterium neoaurum]CDQ43276.1 TQXA domain protein [Mycolicibacterium neoaurum]
MPALALHPVGTAPVSVRRTVRRTADIPRMTRYRGGTYSPTVDTVVFTDGSVARTDLIRLNPGIDSYSVDFMGAAPTRPSRYRPANWSAVRNSSARAYEAEVDWIIRNSYPTLGTVELSHRVFAAGTLGGTAHLAEHEAIAATQAAIWHFTNGLRLDNRPLDVPVAMTEEPGALIFEFDGTPQLSGYTVDLASDRAVSMQLQKSCDGITWRDVTASGLNVPAGRGTHRRRLGVGTTTSDAVAGQAHRGYRFYRLQVVTEVGSSGESVTIDDVSFTLHGSGRYRNADRVVALYDHLIAGAENARRATVAPRLTTDRVTVQTDLLGPFGFHATDAAALSSSAGQIVDAAGVPIAGPVAPGADIYLRHTGNAAVTITARVPATGDGFGGRVLTGIAYEDERLTPVALAIPTPTVIEFEITVSA